MKKPKISAREISMLVFLAVLLIGVAYYLGFYTPLQEELASIAVQSSEVDAQITTAMGKATQMKTMEQELEEIFSRPEEEITEIAPYDNKKVVLNMLYGILGRTEDYSVTFTDPEINDDGTVRRNASLNFSCDSYGAAKAVIQDLTNSNWRCLVTSFSIAADESAPRHLDEDSEELAVDMMLDPVNVTMTLTFFESTKLS